MSFTMGIIGFGGMGQCHCGEIQKKRTDIVVKGAYDINPVRNEAMEKMGIMVYDSADALLNDPEIDLVLVATSNNFHKDYSIRAMRAGKHVLCEKPCMLCSEDLEEVLAVAAETGKFFTVHQNRRWDRDYALVKQLLADESMGKPFFIESRVNGARGIPGDWRCVKEAGGGMMYDWGIHLIDQILQIFDCPITELYCQMFNIKYEDVDDNFKLFMKFANNVCVTIEVGTLTFLTSPRWLIHCTNGSGKVADWGTGMDIVKALDTEIELQESIIYTAAGPTRTMAPRPVNSTEEYHWDIAPHSPGLRLYDSIVEAMESGDYSKIVVQPDEVRRSLRVMEAAFRSAKEGIVINENL